MCLHRGSTPTSVPAFQLLSYRASTRRRQGTRALCSAGAGQSISGRLPALVLARLNTLGSQGEPSLLNLYNENSSEVVCKAEVCNSFYDQDLKVATLS